MESTLGGGGGDGSSAIAIPSPPTNTHVPHSHPVILFMVADLLGREIQWIEILEKAWPKQ
jgi:hypothetical protein